MLGLSILELGKHAFTHWIGRIQSGGLQSGALDARATDSGAGAPLVGLWVFNLRVWGLGVQRSGLPILQLSGHSLEWSLESGVLEAGRL